MNEIKVNPNGLLYRNNDTIKSDRLASNPLQDLFFKLASRFLPLFVVDSADMVTWESRSDCTAKAVWLSSIGTPPR